MVPEDTSPSRLISHTQIQILYFFRLRIFFSESFDGYRLYSLIFQRAVSEVCRRAGDFIHDIHSLCDLPEGSISSVQMRGFFMHDEKLASRGVRVHGSRHGKDARVVGKVICETVLSELALYGISRAAHPGSGRTSALDHKSADDAVEDQTVIESLIYQ